MTIEFTVFKTQAGGEVPLPPQWRIDQNVKRLTEQKEKAQSEAEQTVIQQIIDSTIELVEDLRKKGGGEIRAFNIEPYSRGARRRAQTQATRWEGGQPVLDMVAYESLLVCAATGMTEAEVDELSPGVYDALCGEVKQLCEPSIEQVRFFAS